MEPKGATQREQALPIRAHQMNHRFTAQPPAMQPNAAVEGVTHPLAAARKLLPSPTQLQLILPSCVAEPTGVALP